MELSMKQEFLNEISLFAKTSKQRCTGQNSFKKYLYDSFNYHYKFVSAVKMTRIYKPETFNISSNSCILCFPIDSVIINCSVREALDLTGINMFLKYENLDKYTQLLLFSSQLKCKVKSSKIIVSELNLDSIINLTNNTNLHDSIHEI